VPSDCEEGLCGRLRNSRCLEGCGSIIATRFWSASERAEGGRMNGLCISPRPPDQKLKLALWIFAAMFACERGATIRDKTDNR